VVALFTVATFIAAALVFMVQPMVAKALLPTFGGAPQVWTAAMLFFQAALLGGYGYAHLTLRRLGPRRQAVLHGVVMLLPLLVLPVTLRGVPLTEGLSPALAVLAILALSVGAPYLVVASTSPLIQRWFSVTGHPHAGDPYFLYAAGNAGSVLGLLAYPLIVEPNLPIASQGLLWSIGYVGFVIACMACALVLRRSTARGVATAVEEQPGPEPLPADRPTGRRRLHWVVLAFVPSSLLLGVTTHVQTDIAAVPLLWAIPLSLYLVTFVIAFSPRRPVGPTTLAWTLPFLVVLTVLTFLRVLPLPLWATIGIHELTFFVAALLAHTRLADDRPDPAYLTEFYLLLAVGGVLGGLFNALVAPVLFDQVIEYPMLLVAVLFLRPRVPRTDPRAERVAKLTDVVTAAAVVLLLVAGLAYLPLTGPNAAGLWAAVVVIGTLVFIRRPMRFAFAIGALLAVTFLASSSSVFADRTFFGVNRVIDDGEGRHVYLSGATVHGVQRMAANGGREPLSYYHPTGPAGQVFEHFSDPANGVHDVGLIGLGAGGLAAYNQPSQTFTFYEIDPVVIDIANDPALFTFLKDAPGTIEVVEGDGRLEMAKAPDGSYDVIVLDAFSSDAIPAHIVTREAFELYLSKLRPGGVILANVSNAYLDVRSVVTASALANGMTGFARDDGDLAGIAEGDKEVSSWVALSRDPEALAFLAEDDRWTPIEDLGPGALWTDDFSDILSVIR
jgi:hypothetical protein